MNGIAKRTILGIVLVGLCCSPPFAGTVTAAPPAADAKAGKPPFAQYVQDRSNAILDALQGDGKFDAAQAAASALFDQVVLYANDDRFDAYRTADFTLRLVAQLSKAPAEHRRGLLAYLRKNPDLAAAMVFLVHPSEREKPAAVYAVLERLRAARGDLAPKYANLAAAICVVHDTALKLQINESAVKAPDPLAIFDYYVKHESRMFFGIKNVPAELLVYVVDTTSPIDEMEWALGRFAGNKEVGKLFFEIQYDYDNFHRGTEKAVTKNGYTLPNILKYGGVCADQAYFATEVGKAIGVPTAYTVGASAEVGHAWVGFLQATGATTGAWNFDSGRYKVYQGVRGHVLDPQLRRSIPDSYVSLLAELIGTRPVDRQNCVALADAARRLLEWEKAGGAPKDPPSPPPTDELAAGSFRTAPRKVEVAGVLGLVELALRQSAGYAPAWFEVRDLAVENKLSLADKRRWADVLMRLGAQKYADFTLAILAPMIQTVDDVREQDRLWQAVLPVFQSRFDLAASIKMSQALMWEQHDQADRAGACYMEVIERYANAGPFVIDALRGAEKLLRSSGRADRVVQLYGQTWEKIKPPSQEMAAQFATQSNWYRVGKLYAQKLQESGEGLKAQSVLSKIGNPSHPIASP